MLKICIGRLRYLVFFGLRKLVNYQNIAWSAKGWLAKGLDLEIQKKGKLIIEYCEISIGCKIFIEDGAILKIGNGVFFNRGCTVACKNKIIIGEDTIFGEDVKIFDHDHVHAPLVEKKRFKSNPIEIGKGCWIGSNVVILRGTKIGDNVTVGANCIIKGEIQSDTIVMQNIDFKVIKK